MGAEYMTAEERAKKRVKEYTSLLWHTAAYVVVNAFLWIQDIVGGGGLEYAYWTTIGWGIGLGFHMTAYFVNRRGLGQRKYQQFLTEEREHDMSSRV